MDNPKHLLGYNPRSLHVITFSGAHGVGKSTLVADLKAYLESRAFVDPQAPATKIIPSISSEWFRRRQNMALPGVPVPKTYDDINAMGLREEMQRELPVVLKSSLEELAYQIRFGVVLVDRWFGDIATYTSLELDDSAALAITNETIYQYEETLRSLRILSHRNVQNSSPVYLTHVFVPAASCAHEMPRGQTDDKAHRGTHPHAEWESVYARVNVFTEPHRSITITASDRQKRLAEVIAGAFG